MTRSTDTSHRQPYRAASRATAASIGSGPQAWSQTSGPARGGQRAFERNGHAAALAARSVFGAQHQRDAALLEVVQIEQVGVAPPAVEERELTPRPASVSATVQNGARPTPPATIQTSVVGSGSVKARPSGPRHCTRWPASASKICEVVDADALAENRDADRAVAVAENLEHRKRPTQQRIDAAIGLHHHELPGLGGAGDVGRLEAEHVVVGGKTAVLDHPRVDVEGHGESITSCRVPACRVPECCAWCRVPGAESGAVGARSAAVLATRAEVPAARGEHAARGTQHVGTQHRTQHAARGT